ncbi:flavin reductase family protein [Achromobacter aloeverae]|uniref:Flavin reductase like domain-containing protein n=1 Tax=Achromobacter aloeverae TaxID=1750518 RepID=A0A4Q1HSP2_9BURK|nr:flavin reductase family protein [Achromobacter aloeverae]RXN92955.1 hypothetical protein C7R54_04250 [Achromobacter aloeverae]
MPATPSRFTPVQLEHASRLLNHGPTVLVTSAAGGKRNIMSAAWSMPVEFAPPRIAVVIDKSTYTRELVMASGHVGICVPGAAFADKVYAVGSTSGRDLGPQDKFDAYAIPTVTGPVLGLPLVEEGVAAWLECRLIPERHTEAAYDTFFVEVVSAAADPRVFAQGHWEFNDANADLHTLHHLGAGVFVCAGRTLRAKSLA